MNILPIDPVKKIAMGVFTMYYMYVRTMVMCLLATYVSRGVITRAEMLNIACAGQSNIVALGARATAKSTGASFDQTQEEDI